MRRIHDMRMAHLIPGALCLLGFAGCAVGPDYQAPEAAMPTGWQESSGLTSGQAQLESWWKTLDDPLLTSLIERAGKNNRDLKQLAYRIQEARAARGVASAQYYPNLAASASALATRSSEETTPFLPPGVDRETGYFDLGAGAAWEADLWGRVKRSVESADAGLQATIEDYNDLMIILYAEVAITYVDIRTYQKQLEIALNNVALQGETKQIVEGREKAGLVPQLDVYQAELSLATTESSIPTLQEIIALSINRLAVLIGEMPGALNAQLASSAPIPGTQDVVQAGLPANLLRQRPDIRRAERLLAAQTARIGVATSDLYPRLFLVGDLSLEALDIGNLFSSGAVAYGFGPKLRWNLFSGGRIRATIDVEEARTEQALQAYEQTVLLAVEDVEASLISLARNRDRRVTLERAVFAARESTSQVMVLYEKGLTDFQNVLNMQQLLSVQETELAANEGTLAQNLIRFYKALGGGWPEQT